MNKFLKRLYPFLVFPLVTLFVIIGLNHYIVRNTPVVVPQHKNILVIGDSNPECAVNDSIFDRAYNMSSSGDSYFYSYLKLKKVIDTNRQIDIVLIGFAPHNVVDNDWLVDPSNLHEKLHHYVGVMSYEDLKFIYQLQPQKTITAIPTFFVRSVINIKQKVLGKEIQYPGGFIALERDKLDKDLIRCMKESINTNLQVSEHEVIYLKKILELCRIKSIQPLFLNTPKWSIVMEHPNYGATLFYQYYKDNFKGVQFLDYSNLSMQRNHFGDFVHLNKKGAVFFSKFLKNNHFNSPTFDYYDKSRKLKKEETND